METKIANTNEEWLEDRYYSIGGSDLKKFTTKPRSGDFTDVQFEFIAHSFFKPFEATAQRGHSLEIEALQELAKNENFSDIKALDKLIWRKEDSLLHCSPDATAVYHEKLIGVETKCLSAGKHLRAFLADGKDEFLGDYNLQCANYLYHNEELDRVALVYYCPEAIAPVDVCVFRSFGREDLKEELEFLANLDEKIKAKTEEIVGKIKEIF